MARKPKGGSNVKQLTVYLPEETRKALRIRAIQEGTSATKLVERLILEHLATPQKAGRR
jgi:plasmid stability protein